MGDARQAFDQSACLRAVVPPTGCDDGPDRRTGCIHGGVDLRRQAAFAAVKTGRCKRRFRQVAAAWVLQRGASTRTCSTSGAEHDVLKRSRRSRILCPDVLVCAMGKGSSNMMANWLFTACHARTEQFRSREVALTARRINSAAASSLGKRPRVRTADRRRMDRIATKRARRSDGRRRDGCVSVCRGTAQPRSGSSGTEQSCISLQEPRRRHHRRL